MLIPACFHAEREYTALRDDIAAALGTRSLPFAVSGLCDGATDGLIATLLCDLRGSSKAPALLLLPEEKECVRLGALLDAYGLRSAFYTGRDLTFYNIVASHEYEYDRVRVLFGMTRGDFDVILTTPDAALGYTVSREVLLSHTVTLDFDSTVDVAALTARLVAAGYARVDMVESAGQFAVRGGIIDVFAPNLRALDTEGAMQTGARPLRIELFGDEIDRMGLFDPDTQRLITPIMGCEIPPAREVLPDAAARARIAAAIEAHLAHVTDERAREELAAELAACRADGELRFADKYLSLVDEKHECLLSYFETPPLVLVRGTNAVKKRLDGALAHREEEVKELIESGTVPARAAVYGESAAYLERFLDASVTLHLNSIAEGLAGKRLGGLYSFRTKHTVAYGERFELLLEDLEQYTNAAQRVLIFAENETSARDAAEKLTAAGYTARVASAGECELPPVGELVIEFGTPTSGFELAGASVAVLSLSLDTRQGGLAARTHTRPAAKKKSGRGAILSYADLRVGDLVVHEAHGIGRYMGLETLTIDGVTRDYVSIQYAGSDQLFLPCDRLDSVSKYIGAHADDGTVKLSRFAGGDWKKAKARAKAAVADMAKELITLYAERSRRPGFAFPADDAYQVDFEDAFAYEETEGQLAAAADIKADMMCATPMDRLLCGDVGFGKTEVALRAAYKAILAGKQVAVLVPTTILALQHYQTIGARMRAFAVRVDMISRFRTPKQIENTLARLARGDVDIIVGTHRLISKDVRFKDLGLLIVDEEQRFGVAQKEKIKALCGNVDVLTLTATPIPRTLNMAMSGIRDISVLDEAPGDRLPVQTYVLEDDGLIVEQAIRRELRRGGQVFYLHNFVDCIYEVAATISRAIPEARVAVAHGQMTKDELEHIWGEMLTGEIDVLVSTTIIETGIDVPNANTLIVDNAHRMGLSQLHQLRGRVGRSPRRAYAYFTYPKSRALTDMQRRRLEAIREYAEFGAGFRIALRDLELRGAGNLLGAEQHGHLDAVGYELYVKLLERAVLAERGEAVEEKVDCIVTLAYDACLPERYVKSPTQRMSLYKRISLIETPYDLSDMTDELLDRYGELPRAASNLLQIALIRSLAACAGVTNLRQDGNTLIITVPDPALDVWMALANEREGRLRMVLSTPPTIRYRMEKGTAGLDDLVSLFLRYRECAEKKGRNE